MIIDDSRIDNYFQTVVSPEEVCQICSSQQDAAKEIALASRYLKAQQFGSIETASQTVNYDIAVKVNSVLDLISYLI